MASLGTLAAPAGVLPCLKIARRHRTSRRLNEERAPALRYGYDGPDVRNEGPARAKLDDVDPVLIRGALQLDRHQAEPEAGNARLQQR